MNQGRLPGAPGDADGGCCGWALTPGPGAEGGAASAAVGEAVGAPAVDDEAPLPPPSANSSSATTGSE